MKKIIRNKVATFVPAFFLSMGSITYAAEKVQVGLVTQSWWPTVIAEVAQKQGFFEEEGIDAELTVYQSGGETFTALAAGAADVISIQPSIVATGRVRGVGSKMVALGADGNFGWNLMVRPDSDIKDVDGLSGLNVGITRSGSLSELLALWVQRNGLEFNMVPLGGAGLAPNLISENVDAAVVYSPLSYQVMHDGDGVSILDFGRDIPSHLSAGWAASDGMIEERPEALQKTLNALYGAVAWMQTNRNDAVELLMELNQIGREVAVREYEEQFMRLSKDGAMTLEEVKIALDLAEIGGMTDLAPAEEVFETKFRPVPTRK